VGVDLTRKKVENCTVLNRRRKIAQKKGKGAGTKIGEKSTFRKAKTKKEYRPGANGVGVEAINNLRSLTEQKGERRKSRKKGHPNYKRADMHVMLVTLESEGRTGLKRFERGN